MKIDTLSTLTIALIEYFDKRKPLGMRGITNDEAVLLQDYISRSDFKALEVFILNKRVCFNCYGKTRIDAIATIKDMLRCEDDGANEFYEKNIKIKI